MPFTVGSLFAGIGGFDLAAERVGWEVKWQVEIDDYCTKVLERHWPHVRRYRDIRDCCGNMLRAERVTAGGHEDGRCAECGRAHWLPYVDLVCCGFPCQDISFAGDGAGLDGERSGLWRECERIVGELRPRYVVVENVAALTVRGLGRVLGDLAGHGFDAEWSSVSACAVGLPHVRRRLFIVAYANGEHGRPGLRDSIARAFRPLQTVNGFADSRTRHGARLADPSALYRGADGIPDGPQRNRAIGNSIVPQVAEWIFSRINEAEGIAGDPHGRVRSPL